MRGGSGREWERDGRRAARREREREGCGAERPPINIFWTTAWFVSGSFWEMEIVFEWLTSPFFFELELKI